MWFSFAAFVIALGFLIHSIRTIRYDSSLAYTLLCLFSLCLGVIFFPVPVSPLIKIGLGWFVLLFSAVFLIVEAVLSFTKWLQRLIAEKSFFAVKLPEELTEVLAAVQSLASEHIGALVVIERKQLLDKYIKPAMRFDAQVKAGVLISFFHTNSPLHDGAIVLSKGRIKAVRVILPLTKQADISVGLGTRHRSAIGMSEISDAIVLVSSEERGTISIAYRGKLATVSDLEKLKPMIHAALKGKKLVPWQDEGGRSKTPRIRS